jgi:hypothetical protein
MSRLLMHDRQTLEKWREFYATALFDLPAAVAQSLLLGADRHDREERLGIAAWRAYDAWIWLVNETANQFYSTSTRPWLAQPRHLRLASTEPQAEGQSAAVAQHGFQSVDWLEAR